MRTRTINRRSRRRGGYLYVAVMMVASIVSIVGFTALSVARIGLRRAAVTDDGITARGLARSAVEDAVRLITADPNWRTTYVHGTEYPTTGHDLPSGSFTWKLIDADGNLADDTTDAVWVHGIGRAGRAVFVEKVQLSPSGPGLTCLEASLCIGGGLTLGSSIDITTNQFVSSNASIDASAWQASIDGSAQAAGTIAGNVTGNATTGITPRVLPGSDAFDYYLANGTWIDVNSLPGGLNPKIENVVLTPTLNPYGSGTTNGEGIYVIDCLGRNLTIRNCRIHGTLVLLNTSAASEVSSYVHWTRAVNNYPTLMVNGSIEMRLKSGNLSELLTLTNFNPPGAPYNDVTDGDTLDLYPSRIKGLVYVSGLMNCAGGAGNKATVDGCVVTGSMLGGAEMDLTYRNTYLNYPPPGFHDGTTMAITPGTWERDVVGP